MVTTKNTQSRLREALKQEDSALADRLPAPARASASRSAGRKAPAAAAKPIATTRAAPKAAPGVAAKAAAQPAKAPPAVPDDETPPAKAVRAEGGKRAKAEKERHDKDRHGKVARDSFSMPASEHKRIKALRDALAQAGCEASKSEVLRAGVALLASRGLGEIINLVGELPKVPKGKRGKKR
ncbi:hypothetical protein CGK74_04725 [Thauera propionica]|jgi:hypothetical protein|uniref:Uncharacterized protein n=1 Tax=Thauera propionica TaxID=2019431 RepID=A0A235F2K5_9RHOO|nr:MULTISPECIES: hypothetical protein [Thauera]MDD3677236.1 hypothetical protein [Thauera propionica]MDI3490627.1 hypothetical protein [Thauera sp.]OYD55491.1 hypothetical protein CGK74_04725 [Thauera propionica]